MCQSVGLISGPTAGPLRNRATGQRRRVGRKQLVSSSMSPGNRPVPSREPSRQFVWGSRETWSHPPEKIGDSARTGAMSAWHRTRYLLSMIGWPIAHGRPRPVSGCARVRETANRLPQSKYRGCRRLPRRGSPVPPSTECSPSDHP
jgi:hypothetical protein